MILSPSRLPALLSIPLLGIAAACAATAPLPTPGAKASPPLPRPDVPARLLEDLAMMATGAPPDAPVFDERARIARGESTIEAYVDRLLADPRFARDVAPEMLLDKRAVDVSEEEPWESLRVVETAAGPVYYLRAPCDAAKAEKVHPWWALGTEVRVCPDAYQPTHLKEDKTGWYCGGDNLDKDRSPFCGCGPSLMNCAKDEENKKEMRRALRDEVTRTVAWIVDADRPLEQVFTTNETVRTAESELFYQRWRVIAGEAKDVGDLRAWPAEGKLAPRPESIPGQHAGLLTTPHMLLFGDTPRARMRNFYADLWCASPSSVDVGTEQVLGLGVTDLRDGAGWKKLASMPVCTTCHARLDYGMQFFAGYPSSFVGVVFDAARQPQGHGPLFGSDIHDARGEADLSPHGFATLAVKQPEFFRCMAKDVAGHVFNDAATAEDERAIAAALRRAGTLRAMMREALVRYASREMSRSDVDGPDTQSDTSRTIDDGRIVPSRALRDRLDASCKSCHQGGGERGFLKGEPLPRALVEKMLVEVSFHGMPKAPATMDARERRAMVRAIVRALWSDASTQREALRYFERGTATLPVHRGAALLHLAAERAGANDEEAAGWTFSDEARHETTRLSQSFAITFAYATLKMCKAAGHKDAALDACLHRVAGGDVAVKGK